MTWSRQGNRRSFKFISLAGYVVLAPLAVSAAGCGQTNKDASGNVAEATTTVTSALSTAGARILGFETPLADWTTTAGTRSQSTTRSEGSFSLGLAGTGSATLQSAPIDSLITVGDSFTVDVTIPTQQSGATFGTIQLFIDLPSRGLNNVFIAQRDLVGLPLGRFNRLAYMLPANVRTQLQATYSDLRVRLVLNAPSNGGTWLFDRASFDVQPPGSPQPSIESRLVALETAVTTLQGQVTALQTANGDLTTRVGNLESGLAASNTRITSLEASNTTLTANVASLTSRMNAVEAKNASQDSDIQGLNILVANALSRITALEGAALPPDLVSQLQNIAAHLAFASVDSLPSMVFTGVNVHVRDGSGDTRCTAGSSCNGLGNLIVGYNEPSTTAPTPVDRTGNHNLVVGGGHEYSSYGGFVAGFENHVTATSASVLGGRGNTASGPDSTVGGGSGGTASGINAVVSGGRDNTASGFCAVIAAGEDNIADAEQSSVLGGLQNKATARSATVLGGTLNEASGSVSSVVAGHHNSATASGAAVLGGADNTASGKDSTIAGGSDGTASAEESSISGGRSNQATNTCAAVSGGQTNNADGINSVVGGGHNRTADATLHAWRAGDLFQSE
jgi:hypothetical protein